jgi:hypothetical protein
MRAINIFLAAMLITSVSAARLITEIEPDRPLSEEFSMKMSYTLGIGILPMSNKKNAYLTAKMFPFHYGPADIGFRFCGVGFSVSEYGQAFSFSPLGLVGKKTLVSVDIHSELSDGAGISFSYYFD